MSMINTHKFRRRKPDFCVMELKGVCCDSCVTKRWTECVVVSTWWNREQRVVVSTWWNREQSVLWCPRDETVNRVFVVSTWWNDEQSLLWCPRGETMNRVCCDVHVMKPWTECVVMSTWGKTGTECCSFIVHNNTDLVASCYFLYPITAWLLQLSPHGYT